MMRALQDQSLVRPAAHVNGRWIETASNGRYALKNPATGETLIELPRFGTAETRAAIDDAHTAFQTWKATLAGQRADLLRRWYELMIANREDLARLITLEEGKPLSEARGEIDYAASFLRWFSEEARRGYGDVIAAPRASQRILVLRQPIGVTAAITPWNFPAAMITRKAGPALAAGCTMVVKPASQTPLTALALAELATRAGIPSGVFNVVTGNDTRVIGAELTGNVLVRKVTFTGSTPVGRMLLEQSAATIKKCSMELGGNGPFIVFDDADLDAAVEGLMVAKFRNTGQSCVSANRVLVQRSVYPRFAEAFTAKVKTLKVGYGFDEGVQVGPLIDVHAVAKVEEHIADAVAGGARVLTGGKRHALGGNYFEPTVLGDMKAGMKIACEETFGPVAGLFPFETEEEAIALANDTEYGLAAYFYARDHARIWRVAEAIESGMVGINCGLISADIAPFGGIKQSGLGREGSKYGMDEYIELKYLGWDGI